MKYICISRHTYIFFGCWDVMPGNFRCEDGSPIELSDGAFITGNIYYGDPIECFQWYNDKMKTYYCTTSTAAICEIPSCKIVVISY